MSVSKDIKIIVATHKEYKMPVDDIYFPLQVGKMGKTNLGYAGDDTGDNISDRNRTWRELTGIYWGWKNLDCDYIGLVHYRRYFMYKRKGKLFDSILNQEEAEGLLDKSDIVLPEKRNYRIMTLKEHFNKYDFTIDSDIENLRNAIKTISAEYVEAFDEVMNRKTGHMLNMFIMKKQVADVFFEWEFQVLEEFERRIEPERAVVVAYAAEHMLDIWIEQNKCGYIECKMAFLDKRNEIDRRIDFLMRKLGLKIRRIKLKI